MTADEEALDAAGRMAGVEGDGAGLREEPGEHGPGFESGEGCADAVVDATSEREVVARHFAVEDDVVGMVELVGIAVGSAPEHEQGGVGGDVDAAEGGIGGDGAEEEPER